MKRPADIRKILPEIINRQIYSAEQYEMLARSARNEREKSILREYAEECRRSASEFSESLRMMTGIPYRPEIPQVKESGTLRQLLRTMIPLEIRRSKKYRELYLQTRDNMQLRRAFYKSGAEASERALGILEMLIE